MQYHKRVSQTGHRQACRVDMAAGWMNDMAYTTVDMDCIYWTADTDYSKDHSAALAADTGTAADMVDTEDMAHRPARTGY